MVVQHNISAMNANRMLGITTGSLAKSSEKLASGYRINRAADDAAGLSISEKMRKQIRGLSQASTNAEDGISAVQTAEGALTEVHSMLQRMNELAVQSANGTNSNVDRDAIQSEIDALKEEVDRVSETTKFNETYLLKGGSEKTNLGAKYTATDKTHMVFNKTTGELVTDLDNVITTDKDTGAQSIKDKVSLADSAEADDTALGTFMSATKDSISWTNDAKAKLYKLDENTGKTVEITKKNYTKYFKTDGASSAKPTKITAGDVFIVKGSTDITDTNLATYVSKDQADALSLNLHVGADSTSANKINIKIASMDSDTLGIGKIDLSTEDGATSAIDDITKALQRVSNQRSSLGAAQNRLEHTIANLDNVVENTTSAESRIRDTDMAEEMVAYSKNNILQQAGQSMLAQANQANQGVLSLLQ